MRMPSPLRRAALAVVLLALAACGGDRTGVSPEAPGRTRDAISDGTRALGNPNFFFLPPLLPSPVQSPNFDRGKFVGTWQPEVRICRWSGSACVSGAFDRTYTGGQVGVMPSEELYYVLWDTWEAAVTPGLYRATVRLPGTQTVTLGFVDIELFANNQSFRNAQNTEIVPLKDGRTVPVKFRIEQGAAVQNTGDFFEGVVTNAGGTFATNTGFAGIYINSGWLPPSLSQVTLTIQRIPLPGSANDCHAMGPLFSWLRQREGCYQFSTYPAIGVVQADAIVGVCSESTEEGQVMVKSDATPSGGRRWKGLENVALPPSLAAIIDPACGGFSGIASIGPRTFRQRLYDGGLAFASAVGRAISPQPLYAFDAGVGGRLVEDIDGFSSFGWVIPATLSVASGAGQTVPAGGQADTLIVVTREAHAHDGPGATLSGIPVTFSITGGGGSLSQLNATTDASGRARAIYTAGASAGPFTVTATIPSDSTDAAFPAPDAPPTRTVTFAGTIGTPADPAIDSIRVLRIGGPAAIALGPSSEVTVLVGGTETLQLIPYAGNTPVTGVTCNHNLQNPPSSATTFASTPTFIGNTFTVTGVTQTTATLWPKVFATCGSATRTINVFVTVIG